MTGITADVTQNTHGADEAPNPRALTRAVDGALTKQNSAVDAYVRKLRGWSQGANGSTRDGSSAAALRAAEKQYLAAVTGVGASVGAAAAAPGVGTALSLAASTAEMGANLEATALLVLTCAAIRDVDVDDLESDPMPQLSKSVQLTHLRLSVTHEGTVALEASDEAGVALPGEGKGSQNDPEKDKLSALIEAMNEKFGADLGDGDRAWIDQQWAAVKDNDRLRAVAQHNDRSAYELMLEELLAEVILERHDGNENFVNRFFERPGFKRGLVGYLAGTYDEFRRELVS